MGEMVRSGVPREIVIQGTEYDPAEGATMTYRISGRSGAVHTAGNGGHYKESNPHSGYISQDISVDSQQFKSLSDLQSAGDFVSVTVTTAGNEVLDGFMAVANDEAVENSNGVVTVELAGRLRPR